eukprot:PLAT6717.1.p1 GENE.PLAT6717.1~~PLAT6717.1.p1  ORF type:complete len:301 (+),score=136.71 PLAT6717.1:289-1191(+)
MAEPARDPKPFLRAAAHLTLIADALALGSHWCYDAAAIRASGDIDEYTAPGDLAAYHSGKKAGDFTHIGDQAFFLLQHAASTGTFDAASWPGTWETHMRSYGGYVDSATRGTLGNFDAGRKTGSESHDLAGASRVGVLLPFYPTDENALAEAAIAATQATHNNPKVLAVAEWVARVSFRCAAYAADPTETMTAVADEMDSDFLKTEVAAGIAGEPYSPACSVEGAFKGAVFFISKYQDDALTAIVENNYAGGDNSARAMVIASVLGAFHGADSLRDSWVSGLSVADEVKAALDGAEAKAE